MISGAQKAPTADQVRSICRQALREVSDRSRTEIAFFGGSFTAIDPVYMQSLLEAAAEFTGPDGFSGIRVSTRPDAISPAILDTLGRYGVTAIELGAQSMDDQVLRLNERGHTAADVERASKLIRQCGFSLGLQMMTGLYGDSKESAYHTAEQLIALQPDTVRIYPTVVLRNTQLESLSRAGQYRPQTLSEAVALCSGLLLRFHRAGIRVIRLGLHPSESVEENMVAGAYHPALRELCENRIYRDAVRALLSGETAGSYDIGISPGCISKAIGQKRTNLNQLEAEGYRVRFIECGEIPLYEVKKLNRS